MENMSLKSLFGIIVAAALLSGCSEDLARGTNTGPCYPNGTCNPGLECINGQCLRNLDGGPRPDWGKLSDGPKKLDHKVSPDTISHDTISPIKSYMPLKIGARYEYNWLSGNKVVGTQSIVVSSREPLDPADTGKPPVQSYKIERWRGDVTGYPTQVEWWERQGNRVLRHRKVSYDMWAKQLNGITYYLPSSVVVSDSWTAGKTVVDVYKKWWQDNPPEAWKIASSDVKIVVVATNEPVTVPAGTFSCLKFIHTTRKKLTFGGYETVVRTYWYARNIGQIKRSEQFEQGPADIFVLSSYSLP